MNEYLAKNRTISPEISQKQNVQATNIRVVYYLAFRNWRDKRQAETSLLTVTYFQRNISDLGEKFQ